MITLDKEEFRIKLEEINKLIEKKDYEGAMKIVDSIDWRKVKNIRTLCVVGEIYAANKRYEESREIFLLAYHRAPIGKSILYRLIEVSLRMGDVKEAEEFYDEYKNVAPNDTNLYVLKYKILRVKKAPIEKQIEVLEEYKEKEFTEKWSFELAKLYYKAGDRRKCLEVCDDMILWFSEGKYVMKALDLKMRMGAITKAEREKYEAQFIPKLVTPSEAAAAEESVQEEAGEQMEEKEPEIETIKIPAPEEEKTVGSFAETTGAIQGKIAKGIKDIFSGIHREKKEESILDQNEEMDEEILQEEKEIAEQEEIIEEKKKTERRKTEEKPEKARTASKPAAEKKKEKPAEEKPVFAAKAKEKKDGKMPEFKMPDMIKIPDKIETPKARIIPEFVMPDEKILEKEEEKKEEGKEEESLDLENLILSAASEQGIEVEEPEVSEEEAETVEAEVEEEPAKEEETEVSEEEAEAEEAEILEEAEEAETEVSEEAAAAADLELTEEPAENDEVLEAAVETEEAEISKEEVEVLEEPVEAAETAEIEETAEEESSVEEPGIEEAEVIREDEAEPEESDTVDEIELEEEEESKFEEIDLEKEAESLVVEASEEEDEEAELEFAENAEDSVSEEEISQEEAEEISEPEEIEIVPREMNFDEEEEKLFSYFVKIPGMKEQILDALLDAQLAAADKTSKTGNVIVMGNKGCGKTRMIQGFIPAVCRELHMEAAKVAYVYAEELNKQDVVRAVDKMSGGFLVIEQANQLSAETVEQLDKAMEFRTDGLTVILEDEKIGMRKLIAKYPKFAEKFTSMINIPAFTNDELVNFAKIYTKENGYVIDQMGILALYNLIGSNQKEDEPMTIQMVKQMVDSAIEKAESGARKLKRNLSKKRTKAEGYIVLYEKDFD